MWTRCLEPHCSPDGRSTKDWDASATRSSCLADVYNLGGFLTRKRPSPNLTLAEAYYRTALAHHLEASAGHFFYGSGMGEPLTDFQSNLKRLFPKEL